jgi:2-polyprenyl-3-methyl-5-hydroxy-6-metoxy-1,4-benzoquinol methylase
LIRRLLDSSAGLFDIFTTFIGLRLNLYSCLAATGWSTSTELARQTSTHERYVREWLEQQVVIGTLDVDDPRIPSTERRYCLPIGHAEVLVDRDNVNYLAPLVQLLVGTVHPLAAIIATFETGGGVPFSDYGSDLREGQGALNRAAFLSVLGQSWLPKIPGLHLRLGSEPPARVAEIGSGAGWASIGLACAYPQIRVDGFDLDPASVALATANAREARVADRVRFEVRDASDIEVSHEYDLVLAFECIHDMADPVGVLRAMRHMAGSNGAVIVVDERVGDSFADRNSETEWFMYGFSVLHCLPASMARQPSAATGTVMRPDVLRQFAIGAGFQSLDLLPIEHAFYTFYRLRG